MVSRPGEWEKKEGNVTASIWLGHLGVSSQLQMGRLSSGVLFESCRKQLADLGFGDMFSYISPLQSPLQPKRLRAARPAVRLSARTQKPQNTHLRVQGFPSWPADTAYCCSPGSQACEAGEERGTAWILF